MKFPSEKFKRYLESLEDVLRLKMILPGATVEEIWNITSTHGIWTDGLLDWVLAFGELPDEKDLIIIDSYTIDMAIRVKRGFFEAAKARPALQELARKLEKKP